jgi:hypothetical protein
MARRPVSRREVVNVLTAARQMVSRGWVQGGGVAIDGRLATNREAGLPELPAPGSRAHDVQQIANAALAREIVRSGFIDPAGFDGGAAEMVEGWNDQKGRTQAEVLEVFDSAIARLRRG